MSIVSEHENFMKHKLLIALMDWKTINRPLSRVSLDGSVYCLVIAVVKCQPIYVPITYVIKTCT